MPVCLCALSFPCLAVSLAELNTGIHVFPPATSYTPRAITYIDSGSCFGKLSTSVSANSAQVLRQVYTEYTEVLSTSDRNDTIPIPYSYFYAKLQSVCLVDFGSFFLMILE